MVQKMVDETMKRMAEDPEHSERMQKILQETQAEMDKDPVAFKAQLKAAKDMRMVQLQALLGQVAMLDPADPDVGYVVSQPGGHWELCWSTRRARWVVLKCLLGGVCR
jgi:hypothetical protein